MTPLDELITDRTQSDVYRIQAIERRPMSDWTADEKYYFLYGEEEALSASDGDLYATDGLLTVGDGVVRGAYNAEDLNRVEAAVGWLQSYMNSTLTGLTAYAEGKGVGWDSLYDLPYTAFSLTVKTDWRRADLPTRSQLNRYLSNVRTLVGAVSAYVGQLPTDMAQVNYEGANRIEEGLLRAKAATDSLAARSRDLIDRAAAGLMAFSGTDLYAGEWSD